MRRLHLLYAPKGLLKPTKQWLETHRQLRREMREDKRAVKARKQSNTPDLFNSGAHA